MPEKQNHWVLSVARHLYAAVIKAYWRSFSFYTHDSYIQHLSAEARKGCGGRCTKMPEEKRDNLADDELKQTVAFPLEVHRKKGEKKEQGKGGNWRFEICTLVLKKRYFQCWRFLNGIRYTPRCLKWKRLRRIYSKYVVLSRTFK